MPVEDHVGRDRSFDDCDQASRGESTDGRPCCLGATIWRITGQHGMYVVRGSRLRSARGIDDIASSFNAIGVGLAFESKHTSLLDTDKVVASHGLCF